MNTWRPSSLVVILTNYFFAMFVTVCILNISRLAMDVFTFRFVLCPNIALSSVLYDSYPKGHVDYELIAFILSSYFKDRLPLVLQCVLCVKREQCNAWHQFTCFVSCCHLLLMSNLYLKTFFILIFF